MTNLEYVLQRIRRFCPRLHQVLVPFAHDEVQVLVGFPGDQAIVFYALLIGCERAPAIPVHRLEQRQTSAIEPGAGFRRSTREWYRADV